VVLETEVELDKDVVCVCVSDVETLPDNDPVCVGVTIGDLDRLSLGVIVVCMDGLGETEVELDNVLLGVVV